MVDTVVSYGLLCGILEVIRSSVFDKWLSALRDREGRAQIQKRIARVQLGNFGDAKRITQDVSELRIDFGPGYRVYFTRRGQVVVLYLDLRRFFPWPR